MKKVANSKLEDGIFSLSFLDDEEEVEFDPTESFINDFYDTNKSFDIDECKDLASEYNEVMENLREVFPDREIKKRNKRLAKYDSYVKTKDGFEVEKNGLKGMCDKLGREIVPCILEDGYKNYEIRNGIFIVLDKNGIYHTYSKGGKALAPYRCEEIEYSNGDLIVRDIANNYHIYRKALKKFCKASKKEREREKEIKFFLGETDSNMDYVDKTASGFLVKRKLEHFSISAERYGAYNNDYEEILSPSFEQIEEIAVGFLAFNNVGYSLVDKVTGEVIVSCSNDRDPKCLNEFCNKVVELNNNCEFFADKKIDKEFVKEFISRSNRELKRRRKKFCRIKSYEYCGETSTGFMVKTSGCEGFYDKGLYGIFDNNLNTIVPVEYETLEEVPAGYFAWSFSNRCDDMKVDGYVLFDKITGEPILKSFDENGDYVEEFMTKVEELNNRYENLINKEKDVVAARNLINECRATNFCYRKGYGYCGLTTTGFIAIDPETMVYEIFDNNLKKNFSIECDILKEVSVGFLVAADLSYSLVDKVTGEEIVYCGGYIYPECLKEFCDKVEALNNNCECLANSKFDEDTLEEFISESNFELTRRREEFCAQNGYEYCGSTSTGFMVQNHCCDYGVFDDGFDEIVPVEYEKIEEMPAGYLCSTKFLVDGSGRKFREYRLFEEITGAVMLECKSSEQEDVDKFFEEVEKLNRLFTNKNDDVNKKVRRK